MSGCSGRDPVPGLLGCRQSNEPAPAPSGYAPQLSRWRIHKVKKVLVLALVGIGAFAVWKKVQSDRAELDLWSEATTGDDS